MIVCLCHRLSDRDIERAAASGMASFEQLQDETLIARNCGCCEDSAREVFAEARSRCGGCPARCDRQAVPA